MKTTIIRLLCAVLVLCMCMAITPMRADASARIAIDLNADYAQTRLDSYEQYLAYHYLTFSSLDFFLKNDQLPFQCYVELADDSFRSELKAWRRLTMNVGEQATYSVAEVEFYEFLIFDILYQEVYEDELLNNVKTGVDVLELSILEKLHEAGKTWTGNTKITSENAEQLLEDMLSLDDLKFFAKWADIIEKGVEITHTVEQLIEKLYMLAKLNECSEEVCAILNDLYENATNDLMKEACRRMTIVATGLMNEAEIMAIFSGEVLLSEILEYGTDKLWEDLLTTTSFGQGLAVGQGVGKLACNLMWSTDAVVENWYSMEKVHIFEQVLKDRVIVYRGRFEDNPSLDNAKMFVKAADMYLNTLSVGMEYGIQFYEAVRGEGLFGWLYKNFTHEDDYESVLTELHTIKNSIDLAINYSNNNTYNFYLEELAASGAEETDWEETSCETNQEEVQNTLSALPDILFRLTNQTVSGDSTVTESQTTYGDYSFRNGTLDLAGHTLTVYGDFHLNGTLNVNGGVLDIRGDLHVTLGNLKLNGGTVKVGGDAIFANTYSDGSYGPTAYPYSTRLTMDHDADRFAVAGSLITYFDNSNGINCGMYCSAGEMQIGDDWINYYLDNGSPSGTFRMVFTGRNDLTINGMGNIYAPTLVIENADQRSITMQGSISADTLEGGDMTITAKNSPTLTFRTTTGKLDIRGYATLSVPAAAGGDITFSEGAALRGLALCGHSVRVNGDLWISDNVSLGHLATETIGSLTVDGDLHVTCGNLKLNGGMVDVGGDAVFANTYSDGSYGPTAYPYTTRLTMDHDADRFAVAGSFITYFDNSNGINCGMYCSAGEMQIGDDWINYYLDNGSPSGSFRMIFTGTKALTINGIGNIYAPTLVIENAGQRSITMQGNISVDTLEGGDMTITAKNSPTLTFRTTTGKLDIRGYATLSVPAAAGGDITFSEGAALRGLALCGHSVRVNGDLWISDNVSLGHLATETVGSLTVDGDLHVTCGNLKLNGGMVDVGGDAVFANTYSDGSYGPTAYHGTRLTMDHDADRFAVAGSFITYFDNSNSSNSGMYCSAGEMQIGDGWINYELDNGSPSGSFRIIFTGTKALTIKGVDNIYVPTLVIENAGQRSITMQGSISADTLEGGDMTITAKNSPALNFGSTNGDIGLVGSLTLAVSAKAGGDITVDGDLYSNKIAMGANTLTINGDLHMDSNNTLATGPSGKLIVNGDVWMRTGVLTLPGLTEISGSLFQAGGNVKPNKGQVSIRGDYRIQAWDDSSGEMEWKPSSGKLYMTDENDSIVVWGDFYTQSDQSHSSLLTAGCLAVHGDFYQLSGNDDNFAAHGTHKVFLCGEAHQSACFASDSSMFNILQLNKQKEDYTFNPDPCWKILEEGVGTPEAPTSGSCGKNLTWSFDRESGTLTISGEGEMDEYEFYSLAPEKNVLAPWTVWAEDIRYVVIEDGVTSIGSFGFMRTGVVSVTMTDSVAAIGERAFWQCDTLTKIRLSESLKVLNEATLACCSQLAEIQLPESLETIGEFAIASCVSLTEIIVPAGVTHIGNSAFESCSELTRITFRGDAPVFAEDLNYKTVFAGVQATAYYPAGNETWTADVLQNYGGKITWVPYAVTCEHVPEVRDVAEATCTEPGYTGDTYCTVCGMMIEAGTQIPALGHSFTDYISDGNATCTVDGTMTAVCDRCDITDTVIDEGSKTGHHHEAAVTEPTCTEKGYTVYTCACGDRYVADYVDALGHVFTEWEVVQEPTTDGDGLEIRTCTRCGHKEERPLSKQENPFTDVSASSFYYEPVMWAIENGITNGTSADTFGPNDQCMRAHVVTFLWRAVGSPEPERMDNPFVDVKPSDFYYKAVLWAVENGITNGLDATHFGPFAYCNRAQVVTFLWRAMGSPEPGFTANAFTDVVPGVFYEKAVLWAVENGITNGLSADTFGPDTICNRAQIVTFLYRAYN